MNSYPPLGNFEGSSASAALDVIVDVYVGEGRRCHGRLRLLGLAPNLFQVIPKSLKVIGGHDLLYEQPAKNVPIPGIFETFHAASNAAAAWAAAFNETN